MLLSQNVTLIEAKNPRKIMDLLHGGIQITDKKITLKGCCKLLHEIYESNRTSLRLFSDERQFTIFHWVKWQSCLHLVLLTSTCGILSTEIVAINSFIRLFSTSSIIMSLSMLWQGSSPMIQKAKMCLLFSVKLCHSKTNKSKVAYSTKISP